MRIHAAVALAAVALLGACGDDDPGPAYANRSPEPTQTVTDCQTLGAAPQELAPGCWAIRATGVNGVSAEMQVPDDGFHGTYSWLWNDPPREDHWAAITFEPAGGVYEDPCRGSARPGRTPGTVDAFVEALAAQPVTTTTRPVPATLGGFEGVYVEVTTPEDYDVASCHDQELYLWQLPAEPTTLYAGHVRHLWVLDVAGQPLVLTLATRTDATARTVRTFTGLVEAATIARA